MICIIAGSRDATLTEVRAAVQACPFAGEVSQVISGGARGADKHGELVAREMGWGLQVMPANWAEGRGAGFARNREMAQLADALIAVWDGASRGTDHMITTAQNCKLKIWVWSRGQGYTWCPDCCLPGVVATCTCGQETDEA